MTTIKITKKDMVEAITEYLSAQGQRMTNLKKASEEQLKSYIEKYEINIQEFAKNRKEEMKKQRAIDKKAKEKRNEEDEERNRKWNERRTAIKIISSVLDFDIFRLRDSIHKQLLDTIHYRNNKAEIDAENELNKKICDQMFQKLQNEKPLILERVNNNTINANGVNVVMGYEKGVETHEFYINWSKSYCELELFGNVYDIGLLPTIAEQYKLYINGKSNWIVEKQNRRRIYVDNWGETSTVMPNEVFKFIADKLTDKQIAEINEFIMNSRHFTEHSAEVEFCVKCKVEEPAEGKFDGWLICSCVGNYCGNCSPTNNCPNYPDCDCECEMCAVEEEEEEEICEKCMLIECCCEADRLQVIKDDERARAEGYIEIGGRWVKK